MAREQMAMVTADKLCQRLSCSEQSLCNNSSDRFRDGMEAAEDVVALKVYQQGMFTTACSSHANRLFV